MDRYADGDRWTTDPVRGAELVAEGWLGLDEQQWWAYQAIGWTRRSCAGHATHGGTLIRSPVSPDPRLVGRDPDVPRAVHSGPWIAQLGQFFDGWLAAPTVTSCRRCRRVVLDLRGTGDSAVPADPAK